MNFLRKRFGKKGAEWELGKIILAVVLLVVLLFGAFMLSGKGKQALDFIKNIFRTGKAGGFISLLV